jgi:hypothetical protein
MRSALLLRIAQGGSKTAPLFLARQRQQAFFFSSTATETSSSGSQNKSALRKMIQPFILKCHPDMAKQQDLSPHAQQINLKAIQNVNSYMDGTLAMIMSNTKYPFDTSQNIMQVDFIMALPKSTIFSSKSKKQQLASPTTSRRTVELQVPPPTMSPLQVKGHVQRQFAKLLRIAGLTVSSSQWEEEDDNDYGSNNVGDEKNTAPVVNADTDPFWVEQTLQDESSRRHRRSASFSQRKPKTEWEHSRDKFTSDIDWNKFDRIYDEAVQDMHANIQTQGMIRNSPKRRRALLASIMQNVRVTAEITPLEQLVALRRIFRLLDEEFDKLQLETLGKYWEEVRIVLQASRAYNTSTSALSKRRMKKLETGFSFTIHSNNTVTIRVPIDFHEDELVEELDRNVWDFYHWKQQENGIESVFQ